jgi:hypothetical protein
MWNMIEEKLPSVLSWSKMLLHLEVLSEQEFSRAIQWRTRYEFASEFRDLIVPTA